MVSDLVSGNLLDNNEQSAVDNVVFDLMRISPRYKKRIVEYCS
jgi:hypothetical protein